MKALTVRNPYAIQIAAGLKKVEVRNRRTNYRGDLIITVSAKPRKGSHRGHAVCIVELYDCRPMQPQDLDAACLEVAPPNSWAWCLRNVRLIRPVPVKGRLGIFNLDIDVTLRNL